MTGIEALTAITTFLGAILGIFKYFEYRSKRDKMMLVRESFDSVIKSLSSTIEVERMAGAILLRRFYDKETEVGIAGTPYWKEAVNVTAAILRGQTTSNFQKLMADGLAFAPSLQRADLQRTNLQLAYLGARKINIDASVQIITDLRYADFYRADLSMASLKRAKAQGAVFYQARLHNTVFTGAELQEANFFEADLLGAKFEDALLTGADFSCAKNIPVDLAKELNEKCIYAHEKPFKHTNQASKDNQTQVFISKPGFLDIQQQQYVAVFQARLKAEGLIPVILDRSDYPPFGAMSEVQRLISKCSGVVIFGFKQLKVQDGVWRSSTMEEKKVKDVYLPTPWNQIEAGMAAMLELPMLILCQKEVDGGIFDAAMNENGIRRVFIEEEWNTNAYLNEFSNWCADVRERSRLL